MLTLHPSGGTKPVTSGSTEPPESGSTKPMGGGSTKPKIEGGGFSVATLPAPYHPLFNPRTLARDWHCLTLVAAGRGWGQAVRQQLAAVNGIQPNSHSLWLVFTRLQKVGLLTTRTLTTKLGQGRIQENLQVVYLTSLGREVCTAAGMTCQETDYERLCRLHRGAEFPDHTLALLLFKREAEARGHRVELCPELGDTQANFPPGYLPDARIHTWQDDDWYADFVEVERGHPEPAKWQHNARLNDGHVFVCAPNPQKRATYAAQLRAQALPYCATDLRSLLRDGYSPLWLERDC